VLISRDDEAQAVNMLACSIPFVNTRRYPKAYSLASNRSRFGVGMRFPVASGGFGPGVSGSHYICSLRFGAQEIIDYDLHNQIGELV